MASMGSFPTGVDSSILVHSGNQQRPVIPILAFKPKKYVEIGSFADCNSAGFSRNFADDLFSRLSLCCGCSNRGGKLRMKRVKATQEGTGGGESGNESEDAFQATIQKGEKVLAMQKDLLKQIAERKKLVSSIKNNIVDPEGIKPPSTESNGTTSILDAAPTKDETKLETDLLGSGTTSSDAKPEIQQQLKATSSEGVRSMEAPPFVPWNSVVIPNPETKELKDTTVNTVTIDPTKEDAKPPPLAGANVMNVILVAAECAPWSKTGGLGDVAGALPKALARRGHRVMVIAPRYGNYAEAQDTGVRKRYKVHGQDLEVNYFHAYIDGVDFVFIDSPLLRHIENNIYGGKREDILKRMVLFCKAAIEVPWYVPCGGVCYGDGNLAFIANDWHTALLPVYLKAYYRDKGLMQYTRSVLVIHNIAHQGRGPVDDFAYVDLPQGYLDLFKFYDPVGGEHFNIFAAGLKTADRVVTVSHGYTWELKTLEGGWGLHGIINENDWKLRGIVNGIDTKDWSPDIDIHLKSDGYVNYSIDTLKTGKPQCKAALQKELGLPIRPDVPLIGFIGRLDDQKGIDLIAQAVPWMMDQDVQLVMLGTGRPDLEQMLRNFEGQYKDKVRGWVGFSVKTAHRITAGADVLLMPSRFEPCGLNQLYAMRYGTVPVVHAVGGLRDTVKQFNPFEESGLGWTFGRADVNELIHALGNCFYTYREYKASWEGLQKRGMEQDLSWDNAAQNYEEVLVAAKYQW
ncbi:hypothetical protein RD792_016846 [Penstemon davidsonii]|uniref:Starch synthase catalytic domain-containing protein n=1 Tax=Penstemon davidsonii TaxID=160366 RepID=A0ABR0CKM0_9LAMI|nr:hypothetical protein RD792_016846 [Penstemon davidsonii]